MMELKNLYDKRGRVITQMKDFKGKILKDDFVLDNEAEKEFKSWNDELEGIDKKIEAIKLIDEVEGIRTESDDKLKDKIKKTDSVEEVRVRAKKALFTYIFNPLALERGDNDILGLKSGEIHVYPFRTGMYDGDGVDYSDLPQREKKLTQIRAQSTTATQGGDFIAEDFSREIELRLLYYGPFANKEVCRVWTSSTGADMPYPTVDDTSNTGVLLAEAGDATSGVTDVVTAATTFGAYKFTSRLITISKELEQDSYFDVIGFITDALATRLGRALNTAFTTGTGSSQPQGALVGAIQGDSTASSTAITQSEIMRFLMTTVDWSYLNRPLTRVMFHQNILYHIRLLDISSSNSIPMWQPSFAAGVPSTVLGYSYSINNDMPSALATGNDILLFGDFSKFICRWILPMRIVRLVERYAELDQTGVVAFQRVDSKVIQPQALQYMEMT